MNDLEKHVSTLEKEMTANEGRLNEQSTKIQLCKCGRKEHEKDANYCGNCGRKLENPGVINGITMPPGTLKEI